MDPNSNNDQAFANFSYPTVGATPGSVSQPSHVSSTQVDPKLDEQLAAQLPPTAPVAVSKPVDLDSQMSQLSHTSINDPMADLNSTNNSPNSTPSDNATPLDDKKSSEDKSISDKVVNDSASSTIAPPTFGSPKIQSVENTKSKNPLRSLAKKLSNLSGGLIESEGSDSDSKNDSDNTTPNRTVSDMTQVKDPQGVVKSTSVVGSDGTAKALSNKGDDVSSMGDKIASSDITDLKDEKLVAPIDKDKLMDKGDSTDLPAQSFERSDKTVKPEKIDEIANEKSNKDTVSGQIEGSHDPTATLSDESASTTKMPDPQDLVLGGSTLSDPTVVGSNAVDPTVVVTNVADPTLASPTPKISTPADPAVADQTPIGSTPADPAVADPVSSITMGSSKTVPDLNASNDTAPETKVETGNIQGMRKQVTMPEMNFVQMDPNMGGGTEMNDIPTPNTSLEDISTITIPNDPMMGSSMPNETTQMGVSPVLSEPISKTKSIDPVEQKVTAADSGPSIEQLIEPTPITEVPMADQVHGPTVAELAAKDNSPTPVLTSKGRYPYTIEQLLDIVMERDASDLHLSVGYPAMIRVDGQLINVIEEVVTPEQVLDLILPVLPEQKKELLEVNREVDLAYSHRGTARFRINAYYQQQTLAGAFRLIPNKIRSIDELKLPQVFHQITKLRQGLVLVTGPTGSGKSTTLAAILQEINESRPDHIITIEDPVEYVFPKGMSMVDQRELHEDTHSWEIALKSALRQDPDVMLVGEMRDFDTISSAITLAETGHLVFATLHTNSASQTIDRIIDVFPEHQQAQVRSQLSNTIEAVIAQRLIPISAGGRRAVSEIMLATPAIRNLIRESKNHQIDNVIRTSADMGMISLEHSLVKLVRENVITMERAQEYAVHPEEVVRLLKS